MFDEKKLLKSIEQEEKAGVTLVFDEITFTVIGHRWIAETLRKHLMTDYRSVLGHLVEILGYIPENEIMTIRKIKGAYVVENIMPEVAAETVAGYEVHETERPIQNTGLSYGGTLWQDGLRTIHRCTVGGPYPGGNAVLTEKDVMIFRDVSNGEAAYYNTYRPRPDTATDREMELWRHLESVDWNQWEPAPSIEINGQEEIEDDG